MKICIPTYNRPELKTYPLACSIVGEENVFVFFHNAEDREKYAPNIRNAVITNKDRGNAQARNSILEYFPEGEEIVMMDDDITEISKMVFNRLYRLNAESIRAQFEICFELCRQNKVYLWGVYPVNDAFYMKTKISNKCLMIGWIMGIVINKLRFDETLYSKVDYDYGLQNILMYKKIARFDYLTCNAKINTKGGLDFMYGTELQKQSYELFLKKWAGYVKINPRKEGEVILNI